MNKNKQEPMWWSDSSGLIELRFRPYQMYDYDLGMRQLEKINNNILEEVHDDLFSDPLSATPFNRILYMKDILEYAFAELEEVQS